MLRDGKLLFTVQVCTRNIYISWFYIVLMAGMVNFGTITMRLQTIRLRNFWYCTLTKAINYEIA